MVWDESKARCGVQERQTLTLQQQDRPGPSGRHRVPSQGASIASLPPPLGKASLLASVRSPSVRGNNVSATGVIPGTPSAPSNAPSQRRLLVGSSPPSSHREARRKGNSITRLTVHPGSAAKYFRAWSRQLVALIDDSARAPRNPQARASGSVAPEHGHHRQYQRHERHHHLC